MNLWFWLFIIHAILLLYGLWLVHTVKMKVQEAILRVKSKHYSREAMIECIEVIHRIVVDF